MRVRRWAIGGLGTMTALMVAGAAAWACVSGPAVNLSTVNAKPGTEVSVTGTNWSKADPVTVRWNALDGPVLGTLDKPSGGNISGKITVPPDAKAANYVLLFTQSSPDGTLSQMPVRALLTVTPDGASTPVVGAPVAVQPTADRVDGLVTDHNEVNGATLVLIALGVLALGMFLAGLAALFAARRGRQPVVVKVGS